MPLTDPFNSFSNLSGDFTSVQGALSQYVVSPLNAFGLAGFVFDVEGQSTANLDSDITDHYVEDNSFFQDNIAIHPRRYILRGYVGELVDLVDDSNSGILQTVVQKLTTLNAMLPQLAAGAQQAEGIFDGGGFTSFGSAADSLTSQSFLSGASSLYAAVKNMLPSTKQQSAYEYFKSLWMSKILVSLQTPFEFINNMAILNVTAIQQPDTKYQMDFSITLKEIRYASTTTTPFNKAILISPLSASGGTAAVNPEVPGGSGLPAPVAQLLPNPSDIVSQLPILKGLVSGVQQSPPIGNFTPWDGQAP